MCRLDLSSAATDLAHPFFPCGWEHPFDIDFSTISDTESPGHGFWQLGLQGTLPRAATFVRLSHLDRFMARHVEMNLSSIEFQDLLAWRNAIVHELLSLPTWTNLSEEERVTSSSNLYECCRLAAILYCNASICAVPANCRGITEPMRQLTALLQACDFNAWELQNSEVPLWASFVGGLASFGTEYRGPVIQNARKFTKLHGTSSLEDVQAILHRLLWSDSACELAARAVWTALTTKDDRRIEHRVQG